MCCRKPKNLNVSGSIDGASRKVLICCCGCKQLIRKSVTGRDSRGAAGCGERASSLLLSLSPLLFLLHYHPLLSHQRLPGRHGVLTVIPSHHPVSLHRPFTCRSALNAVSTPPVARALLIFPFFHPVFLPLPCLARWAASSHVSDLLIGNRADLPQHFLLPSMFSTLKLISDRASIFTGLHHSGDVAPSRTSLFLPPTASLHCICGLLPRSIFPPTSPVTKKFCGHPIFLS